ncbi:hypothetical protein GBF35_36840 [Nonomuraea phyllanthi]|uniref:hypothetical protein n=1 Tax=Nonomuraea phyllanthi TaxID=2219224 RepID=UPI0012932E2E|nr:hypothetical protein [Nonomuraea phyllanthi]QFY11411.1 hypothetical protein GBF35_36840 [Nonomuraea phyllanthi]
MNGALTGGVLGGTLTRGVLGPALSGGTLGETLTGGVLGEALTGGRPTVTAGRWPGRASGQEAGAGRAGEQAGPSGTARTGGDGGAEASARPRSREAQKTEPAMPEPAMSGSTAPRSIAPESAVTGPSASEPPAKASPGGLVEGSTDYRADGPSRHTDQRAAEYFRTHWDANDKASKRLKDIRTVGGYLRIYTDLPETADNSSQAITLCRRGLAYLRSLGVTHPIVFVQAEFGENGNPVLANILGPSDTSCRVTYPEPG